MKARLEKTVSLLIISCYFFVAIAGPAVIASKVINTDAKPHAVAPGKPAKPVEEATFFVDRKHLALASTLDVPLPAESTWQLESPANDTAIVLLLPSLRLPTSAFIQYTRPRSPPAV